MILSGANWSCLSLTFNQCWSSKVECHQSLDSISFPQFIKGSLKCSSQLGKKKRAFQDMDLCLSRQHSLSMEWSNLFLVYERRLVHGDHRRSRWHWRLVSLAQTTSSATNSITKLRPAAIYRWLSVWLRHHGWGNLSAGHCIPHGFIQSLFSVTTQQVLNE